MGANLKCPLLSKIVLHCQFEPDRPHLPPPRSPAHEVVTPREVARDPIDPPPPGNPSRMIEHVPLE